MELNTQAIPAEFLTIEAFLWALLLMIVLTVLTKLSLSLMKKLYFLSLDRVYWGFGILKRRMTLRVIRALDSKAKYNNEERLADRRYFYSTLSAISCFSVILIDQNLMNLEVQVYLAALQTGIASVDDSFGATLRSPLDNYIALGLGFNVFVQMALAQYSNLILEIADMTAEAEESSS